MKILKIGNLIKLYGKKDTERLVLNDVFRIGGVLTIEQFRNGQFIGISKGHNIVTNEGLDRILNVMFNGGTQTATWYVAIFESNTTPLAAHNYDVPGYTESTAYTFATRPEYVEATSSAQSITNSANKAVFTMNDTKTIYGGSIVSLNTKGDHTGGANNVLYSSVILGTARSVISGDILNATYTLGAADDGA